MPVEIKELIIRATVDSETKNSKEPGSDGVDKEDIIQTCIEEILKILDRRMER